MGSSKHATPIRSRRKTNQTIKRRLLLKNYIGLVIFKWFQSTDVYKESYTQKDKSTALFQQAEKLL